MDVAFRPAATGDEEWLYALHEAAHRDLVERAYGPWVEAEQRAFFRALVDGHDVFVATRAGRDVGAVYLRDRTDDVWLELIEVLPEQRAGLGAAMLARVAGDARRRGRSVSLQVHRRNEPARRLYEREGYVAEGETSTHHLFRLV